MENLESTHEKRQGFEIDGFVVLFPDTENLVQETEDGISILVDIYRKVDDNMIKVENEEVTPELQEKIEQYLNRMLMSAIENELGEK